VFEVAPVIGNMPSLGKDNSASDEEASASTEEINTQIDEENASIQNIAKTTDGLSV
jgi:hypothetical protein